MAAGVTPAMIRMMGRWSSDVYEIYCRMSLQAALGVGMAISSTQVSPLDAKFEEEHFELLQSEVDDYRRQAGYDEEDDAADGDDPFDPLAVE